MRTVGQSPIPNTRVRHYHLNMLEQAATRPLRGLRVLLIEDSPVLRSMLMEYLQALSFIETIEWADTEQLALRMFARSQAEVVIVDLQLRQGSGVNVLKFLKSQSAPGIRIVYTNHAQLSSYRRQCVDAGANYFFDKSLEMEQVFRVIEEYAQGSSPDASHRHL